MDIASLVAAQVRPENQFSYRVNLVADRKKSGEGTGSCLHRWLVGIRAGLRSLVGTDHGARGRLVRPSQAE